MQPAQDEIFVHACTNVLKDYSLNNNIIYMYNTYNILIM